MHGTLRLSQSLSISFASLDLDQQRKAVYLRCLYLESTMPRDTYVKYYFRASKARAYTPECQTSSPFPRPKTSNLFCDLGYHNCLYLGDLGKSRRSNENIFGDGKHACFQPPYQRSSLKFKCSIFTTKTKTHPNTNTSDWIEETSTQS